MDDRCCAVEKSVFFEVAKVSVVLVHWFKSCPSFIEMDDLRKMRSFCVEEKGSSVE